MQEQEKNQEQNNVSATNAAADTEADAIEALNRFKQNSVSKDEYDHIRAINKRLMDNIANGQMNQSQEDAKQLRKSSEIRDELFSGKEFSNLDYCKKALELREAILSESGQKTDIFVGSGHQLSPTAEDFNSASNVASVLQQCIEYADGDNEVFTNELMRRTNDIRLPKFNR